MIRQSYFQKSCFLYFLPLVCFTTFSLSAQDYYVSNENGSDSNTGLSVENAFATINKGVQAVNPGGTVYVMQGPDPYINSGYGTANPSETNGAQSVNMRNPHVVEIPENKSGSAAVGYTTIRNYPGDRPVIQFDGMGGIRLNGNSSYIIIEGFEVIGPAANLNYNVANVDREWKILANEDTDENTNYNHEFFNGKGIWGGYSAHHHVIIRDNIIHDTTGSGIRFNDSDYITIEYNTVYNTTWWTSSASSAIVFAETISDPNDNGFETKMIMRGNIVYNNWNRILFYVKKLPDNAGNNNQYYGTSNFFQIWDGQGLYVTRSDPGYNGTFLFENNLLVNNGKNGINFDHSKNGSATIRNNTVYYNGVHEIIQDISESEGNTAHRGQKVGGIKVNDVVNAVVVNNIIVTRDNTFSAIQLVETSGTRTVTNNIIVNGTFPTYPNTISELNLINEDPQFTNAPAVVNGGIDMSTADFTLSTNSPAINGGDSAYSPEKDIEKNERPVVQDNSDVISSSSFEIGTDGWYNFGNITVAQSDETAKTGSKSLKTTGRTLPYHSPRIDLNTKLTAGEAYTFYVWVKLAEGSGLVQLTVKSTVNGVTADENVDTYNNSDSETATANDWVKLSLNYTHTENDQSFFYVKGPGTNNESGVAYYIDDFSLVKQGTEEVDFVNALDVIDIGAYEYVSEKLSNGDILTQASTIYAYPNPTEDILTLINRKDNESVAVYDLLGKKHLVMQQRSMSRTVVNVSNLKTGVYIIQVTNAKGATKSIRFIKK